MKHNNMIPYGHETHRPGMNMAKRKSKSRTPAENYTISRKIEQLESQGIRSDRATAAAFRMHREGELNTSAAPKQTAAQHAQRKATKANTVAGYLAFRQARKAAKRRQQRRMQARKQRKS